MKFTDTPREEIEKMVLNRESSVRWLEGKTPKKDNRSTNKIVNSYLINFIMFVNS